MRVYQLFICLSGLGLLYITGVVLLRASPQANMYKRYYTDMTTGDAKWILCLKICQLQKNSKFDDEEKYDACAGQCKGAIGNGWEMVNRKYDILRGYEKSFPCRDEVDQALVVKK
ncbi:hypothetical protein F4811DRAFT_532390 [Daldinia bambusicola]|nr:hypothetical protein F4811DRAFT_532390 [Daldinia bambusicola]